MLQIPNNNLSVLPFYDSIDEQSFRRSYAYGYKFPLICARGFLPPFQLRIADPVMATDVAVYEFELVNAQTGAVVVVWQETYAGGSMHVSLKAYDDAYTLVIYDGRTPIPALANIPQGQYYIRLTAWKGYGAESTTYYSDVITVVALLDGYICVSWWDDSDLILDGGRISYADGFRNFVYLNTEIGKPEYTFEEEGESRDGFFFAEKQISEKVYNCVALMPEYLCDVMRLVRLSDHVHIVDGYGRTYACDQFLMSVDWQEQGDLASVVIEFQTDTVVKKLARASTTPAPAGDFNSDFNSDFY